MILEREAPIMGVTYTFRVGVAQELGLDPSLAGDTDVFTKVIRIRTDVEDFGEEGRADKMLFMVLRHEIFHALLYETGMVAYFDDETLVNWLEVMSMKAEELINTVAPAVKELAHALDSI